MKKITYIRFLAFLCIATLYTSPTLSYAQAETPEQRKKEQEKIEWEIHRSITGVFDTKFPQVYKYKIFPFQFNDETVAFSGEIVSTLSGEKKNGSNKTMVVKTTQTFGEELTYRDVKKILNRNVTRYKQSAKALGGTVITNEDIDHKGFLGKNIYISYSEDGVKYGLRIRLYMTNFSKVEQILSGPGHTMYSYRSDDFFNSLTLHDGITGKDNPIGAGWLDYTSKNNIFTVTLPPPNSDYTPQLPKFSANPQKEKMTFKIIDPVLDVDTQYNVYTYKSKNRFSYKKVKSILASKHIAKFVKNAGTDSLKTDNKVIDGTSVMKTALVISPRKNLPNINTVFLEARYKGNTLLIQEFLCSNKHAKSGLSTTLFSQIKFHPEKYKAVPPEKKVTIKDKPAKEENVKQKEDKRHPSKK